MSPFRLISFHDGMHRLERYRFADVLDVAFLAHPHFFFEDQSSLDDQYLVDDGNDRRIALLSHRWHGLNLTINRDPFHDHVLACQGLFNPARAFVDDGPDTDAPLLDRARARDKTLFREGYSLFRIRRVGHTRLVA